MIDSGLIDVLICMISKETENDLLVFLVFFFLFPSYPYSQQVESLFLSLIEQESLLQTTGQPEIYRNCIKSINKIVSVCAFVFLSSFSDQILL